MPTNAYQLGRSISVARIERIDTGAEIIPKATSDGLAMTMLTDPAGLRQVGPVARSLSPRIYNTTLVLADTEYSQALASGLKRLLVCTQDLTAFRVAFQTGLVAAPTAPYLAVPASTQYYEDGLHVEGQLTVFVAGSTAGKVVQIVEWT